MLKRLLSLVLAMALLCTAAVPVASATAEPSKAPAQNPWERSHELEANTSEEYSIFHAEFALFRILDVDSSNSAVATGSMRADRESYSLEEFKSSSPYPSCNLYYSVHAHSAGTATITYRFALDMIALTVYNDGSHEFFAQDTDEFTLTVHVTVPKKLNPPKVELKITTQTPKLVTGYPRWVDDLELLLDGWGALFSVFFDDLPELLDKKVPFKTRITKYVSKSILQGVAQDVAFTLLKRNLEPIVEPEVYLDINLSNPDNDIYLKYEIDLHSEKADTVPIMPGRTDEALTDKYSGVLLPGDSPLSTRHLITPEALYGGGEYQAVVNISIPWQGYDYQTKTTYEGGVYEDSFTLFVTSELGPESMYREVDTAYKALKDANAFSAPPGSFDLLKLIETAKKQSSSEPLSKPAQQLKNLIEKPRVVSPETP